MKDRECYYIVPNGARSNLTALEKILASFVDKYGGWVMSRDAVTDLAARLAAEQDVLLKERPQRKPVSISFREDEYMAYLLIGQFYVACRPVNGFDLEDREGRA